MIPEDWNVSTVGEEFHIQLGKMLDAEKNIGTPKPFLGNRAVQWGWIDLADIGFIKLTPSDLSRFRLRDGDLLVCEGGEVGRSAIWRQPLDECYYQKALHRLRPKKGFNIPLMQNLLHKYSEEGALQNYVTQTSIAHLPKDKFETLPIPVPSPAEQQAIAEALSDADGLIESLEQLLTKKRQIKKGAMRELLTGERRLPGFSGEWMDSSLLELAGGRKDLFDDGDWIESEHITSDGVRLVQTGNIGIGKYVDKSDKKYIYETSFTSLHCKEVNEGDLLICRLAEPAGRACLLPNIGEEKIVTSVDVTIFRPPLNVVDRAFLVNLLSMPSWFQAVSDRSGGTTHKRISRGMLGRIRIKLPELSEQSAIASFFSWMDSEITALETQLQKARQLKQAMMQELLTGRIRLV